VARRLRNWLAEGRLSEYRMAHALVGRYRKGE
jgi:hypothetical protein